MSLFSILYGNKKCKLLTLKNPTVVYLFESSLFHQQVTLSPVKQFTLLPGECYMRASFVRGYLDELVVQEYAVLRGRNDYGRREAAYMRCTYQSRDTSAASTTSQQNYAGSILIENSLRH
ncbi:hypothetical protein HY772_02995 [Candidatus Woesearchaeota archaeon]|nr:hypothetical protein [Candidatus Woesearchaeota archaeon]